MDRRTLGSSTRAVLLWNSPQGPPSEERRTDAAENKEEKRDIDGSDHFICPWGTAHGTLRAVMVEPGKNERKNGLVGTVTAAQTAAILLTNCGKQPDRFTAKLPQSHHPPTNDIAMDILVAPLSPTCQS